MGGRGLLGEKLGHSFSPQIHKKLCGYEYELYEVSPEKLEEFLLTTELDGMNVTIPYKKAVLPYCSFVDGAARRIGSVNTLVRRADGWHGYNTDYFGFRYMLEASGYNPAGKKAVVLGSGGASLAVCTALEDMGAADVVVISRSGENNYENLSLNADADVLINATPVGMYPKNGESPVSLAEFPACRAVFDLIYNPARTELIMQAQERGLICAGGLGMLVAQAHKSAELFTGSAIDEARIAQIHRELEFEMLNIILVGMPGCGKSAVGRRIAAALGREFCDADELLEAELGISAETLILERGEEAFRALETELLCRLGKRSGLVIATGGGCVTREENYRPLHQNGSIVWLQRDLALLPTDGRPLSQGSGVEELYLRRKALYARFADVCVESTGVRELTAEKIVEVLR